MDNQIATAWNEMVERQQVLPEEVAGLVEHVRSELLNAMSPDASPPGGNGPNVRYAVEVSGREEDSRLGGILSNFAIKAAHGRAVVGAEVNIQHSPRVQAGDDRWVYWTPDCGKQRAWILNSLRANVVGFLSAI